MKDEQALGAFSSPYHVPVLLDETIQALQVKPGGVYADCTFGGGGHGRAILEQLNEDGRLIAFDHDADAFKNIPADERIIFVQNNFRHVQRFLRLHGYPQVDGLLADLGVSSHHFNEAARGFSTRFDGPLDMRMDQRQQNTASDILKKYTVQQLHKLFEQYGEVTNAKTLAEQIVRQRNSNPLQTIAQLKAITGPMVKGNPNKYFAQVFQALRMEVNEETDALKEMLQQLPAVLKPGGRAAIITFHSIEDRLVKNFFRYETFEEQNEHSPIQSQQKNELIIITKKPIVATPDEVKRNPRSRSAKLRVAEKRSAD